MILPTDISLQLLNSQLAKEKGVQLYVLRLDTIDHYAGGNKFFKLKYNLEEAQKHPSGKILTFGGAWSNHLAALAASGRKAEGSKQMEVIAIIRGEEPKEFSDTLRFCKEKGMQLHFVSREDYRKKDQPAFIMELKKKFGDFYLLPEGGSNHLAVNGCREILGFIDIDFDVICCPVGSGGTISGIASGLKEHQSALGFVAIKGGEYLEQIARSLGGDKNNFELLYEYHFEGFAKTTSELIQFKKQFEKENGFELDHVYTSKMCFGIYDLLQKNYFKPGSTIVAVHTGGLQGNKGFTGS